MIKQTRRRFIVLSMILVLVLMVITVAGINLLNYSMLVRRCDSTLTVLSKNRGHFPADKQENKNEELPSHFTEETAYESRYFWVRITEQGEVLESDLSHVAAVTKDESRSLALEALGKTVRRGFADRFRYVKIQESGSWLIIFLDCAKSLGELNSFLWSGVIVAVVCYALSFVAILLLSEQVIQPVVESHEKQKRFVTDAGHEIKTPLAIINANADLWEMENGENELVDEIKHQTARLSELTHRLVYLAKMDETETEMRMTDFSLTDLVKDTVRSFHASAHLQGKTLMCAADPLITYCGNELAMGQLIAILLDNALKYSTPGGSIGVLLKRHGKKLLLRVWNTTAAPLSEEQLARFFDRFYRTDSSRNSGTGGYGIGLSIAKSIVWAHHGRIVAQNGESGTLELNIHLPLSH